MKRPSFQFYPSDWRNDTALQFCSLAARGLWIEMMCIAHDCQPYGHLCLNGKPMSAAQIGRLVGISERECNKLLNELHDAGVTSVSDDSVIYSRRMVRDEQIRERRAEGGKAGSEYGSKGGAFGKKGGRPKKQNTPQETPLSDEVRGVFEPPLKPPPSSSSSSSSSSANPGGLTHTFTNSEIVGQPPEAARASDPPSPTASGEVCRRMKSLGYSDTNPHDPKLSALLAAGLTPDELVAVGEEAKGKGKGFRWVLAAAEARRRDADQIKPLPPAKPSRHTGFDQIDYRDGITAEGRF